MSKAKLLDGPLSIDRCVAAVAHKGAGAVVVMLGCVRDHTRTDGRVVVVTGLEYQAYVEMAERVIDEIVVAVEGEFAGVRAVVEHRTGALAIGDLAVVVAVSSPHRKDAFVACQRVIDRLKEDAPIWKREHDEDGVTWVGLGP
jgi:molybdopterin synthase catalytic subunit